MINATETLKSVPLSMSRLIALSAINIVNAGILINDSQAAAAEAARIYTGDRRGMWRKVQADAHKVLETAIREGLTSTKPYVIKTDSTGQSTLYFVSSSGELYPA